MQVIFEIFIAFLQATSWLALASALLGLAALSTFAIQLGPKKLFEKENW